MNKEIIYSGLAAIPADHDCPDGQFSTSIGAILDDAAIRPILPPREIFTLSSPQDRILCIHRAADRTRYIILRADGSLCWRLDSAPDIHQIPATLDATPEHAIPMGNVLILTFGSSAPPYYIIWRDSDYVPLGCRPPLPDNRIRTRPNEPRIQSQIRTPHPRSPLRIRRSRPERQPR